MKAANYNKYGSPENFFIQEMPAPVPDANELLIEVYASTVNRSDCAILEGSWIMRLTSGLSKPRRNISGTDFAGKVIQIGEKVTQFKVGDRVFGFNDLGLNSHAEFLAINADKAVSVIPDNLSYEEAAASLETAHYAINFLNKVKTYPGQKVLINGGTSGIGSVLVQLSGYYELNIAATCRTEHMTLVKNMGAHHVVDYTNESFLHSNDKFDFVFDAVGKSTFGQCKAVLKDGGIYISSELGPYAQNPFLALATKFGASKKVKFPIPFDTKASIRFITSLIEQKKFKPLIDRKYALDDIQEAFKYVSSGQKVGNVIIDMKANK